MQESTVVFMRMVPGQKHKGKLVVKPHDCDRCNRFGLARECATSGPNLTGIAQRMFSRRPECTILTFIRRGDLPRVRTDLNLEMASDRGSDRKRGTTQPGASDRLRR